MGAVISVSRSSMIPGLKVLSLVALVVLMILVGLRVVAVPFEVFFVVVKVVMQCLILDIAVGKRKLVDFVDPVVGVVFIDYFEGVVDIPSPWIEKLMCGENLTRFLRIWQKELKTIEAGDSMLHCRNRSGPPICIYGNRSEGDPKVHLIFRVYLERGILFIAVIVFDASHASEKFLDDEARDQETKIKKLSATGCAAVKP